MAEQLIPAKITGQKLDALKTYVKRRILGLKQGSKELFEDKITRWRSAYEARPAEEIRQFPFQNASNLVIPIIAIHTDTLAAQVMAGIFKTPPLVVADVLGDFGKDAEDLKEAYEEYMNYVGIEPRELDLYRVYSEGIPECIKYGTVTYKTPWELVERDFYIPGGDGSGSAKDFESRIIYEGPRPEKLPFSSFGIPPQAKSIEDADFKYHKRIMLKHELEDRKFRKVYDGEAVDKILISPDRTSPNHEQQEKEEDLGSKTSASFGHQEWDIYECYMTWRYADEAFAPKMIVTYHEKSDTVLRVMYDNMEFEWFVGARMCKRDDMYHGMGFAEALWYFQEGISETYNGYRDNQTVANTRVWRVEEDSKLNQGYRIYPGVMLPGKKDEIEPMAHGELSDINIEEIRLLLDLAERRSGVSPPQQGMGAGMQTKRGIYSAMGTLAVMQEGNSRKDLNVSDVRDAHVRLMRLCTHLYGVMGPQSRYHGKRLELFGKKADKIKRAIELITSRRMGLPCYSSSASVNREVEKQNEMMLSQIMVRHYQMITQLLAALQNAMTPPLVKEYLVGVIGSSNLLMKKLLRDFGHNDAERLLPDPLKTGAAQQAQPQQPQLPQGGQPPNVNAGPTGGSPNSNASMVGAGPTTVQ